MGTMWLPSATVGRAAPARMILLFKRDRPRAIDRYIDYFGDSGGRPSARDTAYDVLLETA